MASTASDISSKIRNVTSQLVDLERELKSGQFNDVELIRAFRDALDRSRTTAWTISELLTVRHINTNPDAALPFLLSERIRRFTQMTKELCADLDSGKSAYGVSALSDALQSLQVKLRQLTNK
jgi:hypothetical protein